MYYTFIQHNSGGDFIVNNERGISYYVIIEANSAEDADRRAIEVGIYFDGCDKEIDCDCCGDRWDRTLSANDGKNRPQVNGVDVLKAEKKTKQYDLDDVYAGFIHYLNGRIKSFSVTRKVTRKKKGI